MNVFCSVETNVETASLSELSHSCEICGTAFVCTDRLRPVYTDSATKCTRIVHGAGEAFHKCCNAARANDIDELAVARTAFFTQGVTLSAFPNMYEREIWKRANAGRFIEVVKASALVSVILQKAGVDVEIFLMHGFERLHKLLKRYWVEKRELAIVAYEDSWARGITAFVESADFDSALVEPASPGRQNMRSPNIPISATISLQDFVIRSIEHEMRTKARSDRRLRKEVPTYSSLHDKYRLENPLVIGNYVKISDPAVRDEWCRENRIAMVKIDGCFAECAEKLCSAGISPDEFLLAGCDVVVHDMLYRKLPAVKDKKTEERPLDI